MTQTTTMPPQPAATMDDPNGMHPSGDEPDIELKRYNQEILQQLEHYHVLTKAANEQKQKILDLVATYLEAMRRNPNLHVVGRPTIFYTKQGYTAEFQVEINQKIREGNERQLQKPPQPPTIATSTTLFPPTMTVADAAEDILKESPGAGMHTRDILSAMKGRYGLETTPKNLASTLMRWAERHKRFKRVGPNRFVLRRRTA